MDRPFHNLQVGIRSLLKSPLTTIPALLSLALGIAATTTIFSVTDIVLFQPLRFQEPERLVAIWGTHAERGWRFQRFSSRDLLDYRECARGLDIAGYRSHGVNLSGTDQPERLSAILATSNIFAVTGFEPVYGRAFTGDEEIEGRHRVVVLGHDLWQRNFGSDPSVVGKTVKLDGIPYTVTGIMPPAIPYPFYQVDAWMPPGIGDDAPRDIRVWNAVGPPETKYPETDSLRMMYADLIEDLRALPGISFVGSVSSPPLTGRNTRQSYIPEGDEYEDEERPVSSVRWADAGYFETIDVAMVHGRGFSEHDVEGSPRVIVISEALAERHWAQDNPVGERIEVMGNVWEVIGVVRDLHHQGPDSPPTPIVYFPTSQSQRREMAVLLRTEGAPEDLIPSVRDTVLSIDPDQPIFEVTTMRERLRVEFEGYRIVSDVNAVLGMIALIMAVVGVYGVMAYSVSRRIHETGIRIALGATPRDIERLIARRGAAVTVVGLVLGLLMSLGMMRVFDSIFEGFIGFDVVSLTAASFTLLLAALGASYLPARRAGQLDPVVALRTE